MIRWIILAVCVAVIAGSWANRTRPAPAIDWHGMQTCLFSSEDTGSKLGNMCSRLDPATKWALRQRI